MNLEQNKNWSWRFLRLPSFGSAIGISAAVLLAFVVWILVDASFPFVVGVVQIDLGLDEHPGIDMGPTHGWDLLGPRLLLFVALAVVGALSTVLVFYRVVFGSRQGRSLLALFGAVALVGVWLTLFLSFDRLQLAGQRWRLHRAVSELKTDAAILLAQWPTTDGVLPFVGAYSVDADNPDLLIVGPSSPAYRMNEEIGPFITRTQHGALTFDYNFIEKIEYHPQGDIPNSFTQSIKEGAKEVFRQPWVLDDHVEIEPNWFWVSYLPDVISPGEPDEAGDDD